MESFNYLKAVQDAKQSLEQYIRDAASNEHVIPGEVFEDVVIGVESFNRAIKDLREYGDGACIATFKDGDHNFADLYLEEIESLAACDFEKVHYDTTTYVFGPNTTEAQINDWAAEHWPDRVVKYTAGGGIEFDYEEVL